MSRRFFSVLVEFFGICFIIKFLKIVFEKWVWGGGFFVFIGVVDIGMRIWNVGGIGYKCDYGE